MVDMKPVTSSSIGAVGYGEQTNPMGMMYAAYPFKAAYCGDINLIGDRRPVSYWREIIWGLRTKPFIAVQPPAHYGEKKFMSQWVFSDSVRSWTYGGYEGKGVAVEVYADADEVELFINGRSVGRKAANGDKRAFALFDTVYEPGRIEAVAYRGGVETGRDVIETASGDVHLEAKVSLASDALPADGSDIAYIDISVVDAKGILNTDRALPVSVSVEGPAVLAGYGSASPCNEENYFDTCALTYEGRIRAAVRATAAGTIKVTFTADGLQAESLIEAR